MSADRHPIRLERLSQVLLLVAWLWFAFAAAWGMFQIPGAGHTDSGSAGTTGDSSTIVRFMMVYPSGDWYAPTRPSPATYYCHHPFGVFYYSAFFLWIFGHRDFVVHLSPVLMSIAIPPLLYGIGSRYRGSTTGAVAACAYVVVPIAVGFSNYNNLETPTIFGSLLFFWGHSAHHATGKKRHLAASLLGLTVACASDWAGYLMVAPLLAWALLRAFALPARWTPFFNFRRYARWWALSTAIAVGTFLLWVVLFMAADKVGDWLASAETRRDDGTPLELVLQSRKNWIDFSFTPLAVWLGKAALPICLLRLLLFRQDEEVYSLSILFGSVVQYLAFKRGADIHIFWPHYFAAYYALAMAQLASTLGGVAAAGWRLFVNADKARSIGTGAALALGLVPSLAMAPDAVRSLPLWRRTGGRYDDRGVLNRSDIDLLSVVKKVIVPRKPPDSALDVHPSSSWWWEHSWAFNGPNQPAGDPGVRAPGSSRHPFWLGRASGLLTDDQLRITGRAHVQVYGDVWVVDQRVEPAPLDAWRVDEREPNPLEWLVYGGWEPVRRIDPTPDPLRTWEIRLHLNQPATPPKTVEARTLEDLRILHNAFVYETATDRAQQLREKIEAELDRSVQTGFEQGLELIGVRVTRGVQPRLEIWFIASGPLTSDDAFHVRSSIQARAPLSLIPADTTDCEVSFAPSLPTKLWRSGFIYKLELAMNHRIGLERFSGAWVGNAAPRRLDGQPETTLAIVR
jgi:4-amino-4-deoxy-L-arabinose transferase-like glycosyltransferase